MGARRIALDLDLAEGRLVVDGDPGPPPYLMGITLSGRLDGRPAEPAADADAEADVRVWIAPAQVLELGCDSTSDVSTRRRGGCRLRRMSAAHSRSAEPRLGLLRAPPVPHRSAPPGPETVRPSRHAVEQIFDIPWRRPVSTPIDTLSPDPLQNLSTRELETELLTLAGHVAAAQCRFLLLLAEYDRRGGWAGPELRSCAHWLSWRIGMSLRTASERVRVAHALAKLPRRDRGVRRLERSPTRRSAPSPA